MGLSESGVAAWGYDSPTFDSKVFSADGVFLSASEKESLLEALTALAVNFTSSREIDSDLQEKALGIALQINPLYFSSRSAHEALLAGKDPEETEFFDSLSAVSEALWRTSSSLLASPAEPEEIRLAPFLMELSLLIHPEPPADRMKSFALRSGGKSLGWNRFLELDANVNPSTERSQKLLAEANDLLRDTLRETSRNGTNTPTTPPKMKGKGGIFSENPSGKPLKPPKPPGPDTPLTRPIPTTTDFEPIQVSVPTIRNVTAISALPIFGSLELLVRPPSSDFEESLFPYLSGSDPSEYPQLPLISEFSGISLENIEIPSAEAAGRSLSWPAKVLGHVSFETDEVLPGPRRLCKTSALLPTLAAIQVALGEKTLNPDFVLAGSIAEAGSLPALKTELKDFVAAIPTESPHYILVPESSMEKLVTYLQVSENLGALFAKEWVSYDSAEAAISTLTSETATSLSEASRSFDEIEGVSERMSLVELARNVKVQERLAAILETYPQHLSARAMLEFGRRPIPESIKLEATATKIVDIVSPFLELKEPSNDLNTLRGRVEDAQTALFRMRSDIQPELLDFHSSTVTVVDAAESFLGFTNTTSSLAAQKLRELQGALDSWEASKEALFDSF